MPLGAVSLLPFALLAVGAPVVLALAPRRHRPAFAALLASLALAHAGLYLLFYSRTLCWVLVGAAASVATLAAFPRRRLLAGGAVALAGLALGLAFEATPGDAGLALYVAGATPLLLAPALAAVASRALAWEASRGAKLVALALVAFAGLVPLTSFFPAFLLLFEPLHAPILALVLVALGWAARSGWARVDAARDERLAAATVGEFVGATAAAPGAGPLIAAAAVGALLLAASAWLWPPADAALAGVAAVLAGLALASIRAPIVASLAALAASCVLAAEAAHSGVPLRLGLASLALVASALALAFALASAREAAVRERATRQGAGTFARSLAEAMPPGALVAEGEPDVRALESLAARLRASGAPLAVLVARSPEPLWSVPDDAYAWLLAQPAGRRVHVAVVEGSDVSFVPPALEGLDA